MKIFLKQTGQRIHADTITFAETLVRFENDEGGGELMICFIDTIIDDQIYDNLQNPELNPSEPESTMPTTESTLQASTVQCIGADVRLKMPTTARKLLEQALDNYIQEIRAVQTRNPASNKASRQQGASDIATLQNLKSQLRHYTPALLITEDNLGIITSSEPFKFTKDILAAWEDHQPVFTLNLPSGGVRPVLKSDYAPGVQIRFQFKQPATILNHIIK